MNQKKIEFIQYCLRREPFLTYRGSEWNSFTEQDLREAVGLEVNNSTFGWKDVLLLMLARNNKYSEDFFREVYDNTMKELPTLSPSEQRRIADQMIVFAKRFK